jgi:hypothetical protein
VLDFGICKMWDEKRLTATGIALGTPRFMSPEQLEARSDLDQRADIYAVRATLFFALSRTPGGGQWDHVPCIASWFTRDAGATRGIVRRDVGREHVADKRVVVRHCPGRLRAAPHSLNRQSPPGSVARIAWRLRRGDLL